MSWSDLLFEMDVLFVLPAFPLLLFVIWAAADVVARLARSTHRANRFGTAAALLPSGCPHGGASKFHRT